MILFQQSSYQICNGLIDVFQVVKIGGKTCWDTWAASSDKMYVGSVIRWCHLEDSQLDRQTAPLKYIPGGGRSWVSIALIKSVLCNLHQPTLPRVEPLILTIYKIRFSLLIFIKTRLLSISHISRDICSIIGIFLGKLLPLAKVVEKSHRLPVFTSTVFLFLDYLYLLYLLREKLKKILILKYENPWVGIWLVEEAGGKIRCSVWLLHYVW